MLPSFPYMLWSSSVINKGPGVDIWLFVRSSKNKKNAIRPSAEISNFEIIKNLKNGKHVNTKKTKTLDSFAVFWALLDPL